jgi:hypothetical protein
MSVLMASESRFERATGRVLGDAGAVGDDLDLVDVGDPGLEPQPLVYMASRPDGNIFSSRI